MRSKTLFLRKRSTTAVLRERYAFTLLELMICLAILVTIMGVAWPSITRRMQQIGPREAALQVKADLAVTREQAIVTGEAWVFRVHRGSRKYEFGPVSAMKQRALEPTAAPPSVEELLGISTEDGSGDQSDSTGPALQAASSPSVGIGSNLPSQTIDKKSLIRDGELPPSMVFDDGFAHSASDQNQIRIDQQATPGQMPLSGAALPPGAVPVGTLSAAMPPPVGGALPLPVMNPMAPNALPTTSLPDQNWKYAVIFQPDGRSTNSEIRLKEVPSDNKITLRVRAITGGVTIDRLQRKPPPVALAAGDPLAEENLFEPVPQNGPAMGGPNGYPAPPLPAGNPVNAWESPR